MRDQVTSIRHEERETDRIIRIASNTASMSRSGNYTASLYRRLSLHGLTVTPIKGKD